jgi:Fic family protein
MSKFIKRINNAHLSLDAIANQHAEFEKIHPFLDGNGRIGRSIVLKQCLKNDIVPIIINSESKQFYYSALQHYFETGKDDLLILFFKDQQKIFEQRYRSFLS